jgi:hypothetical protein
MVVDYFPYFLTIGNQPPSDFLEHMNLIMLIQTGARNMHVWRGMEITSNTGLFHDVALRGLFGGILLDIYGFIVVG